MTIKRKIGDFPHDFGKATMEIDKLFHIPTSFLYPHYISSLTIL